MSKSSRSGRWTPAERQALAAHEPRCPRCGSTRVLAPAGAVARAGGRTPYLLAGGPCVCAQCDQDLTGALSRALRAGREALVASRAGRLA